jgi:hypothetical protein
VKGWGVGKKPSIDGAQPSTLTSVHFVAALPRDDRHD